MTNLNAGERWREDFRNRFWEHRIPKNTKQAKDIEDYISSLLAAQMEEVEKSLKYKDFEAEDTEMPDPFHVEGYNMAITEFKALLRGKRGERKEGGRA